MRLIKKFVRDLPFVGHSLKRLYRRLRFQDERICQISSGPLAGYRYQRFLGADITKFVMCTNEAELTRVLGEVLFEGATFFDVGANGGYFTMLAGSIVGDTGAVVGFEPHPETAFFARRQLKLNALHHCRIVEAAVADKCGYAYLTTECLSMNKLVDGSTFHGPSKKVATTTLDAAAQQFGVPHVVKIDIEGAEIAALEGARGLLANHAPRLLVELHDADLYRRYLELVSEYGYVTTSLDGARVHDGEYVRFVNSEKPTGGLKQRARNDSTAVA